MNSSRSRRYIVIYGRLGYVILRSYQNMYVQCMFCKTCCCCLLSMVYRFRTFTAKWKNTNSSYVWERERAREWKGKQNITKKQQWRTKNKRLFQMWCRNKNAINWWVDLSSRALELFTHTQQSAHKLTYGTNLRDPANILFHRVFFLSALA